MISDFIVVYTQKPEADDNYSREFVESYMSDRVPDFKWFSKTSLYPREFDAIVERFSRMKGRIDRARLEERFRQA